MLTSSLRFSKHLWLFRKQFRHFTSVGGASKSAPGYKKLYDDKMIRKTTCYRGKYKSETGQKLIFFYLLYIPQNGVTSLGYQS